MLLLLAHVLSSVVRGKTSGVDGKTLVILPFSPHSGCLVLPLPSLLLDLTSKGGGVVTRWRGS